MVETMPPFKPRPLLNLIGPWVLLYIFGFKGPRHLKTWEDEAHS